jgi:hypothetical protein
VGLEIAQGYTFSDLEEQRKRRRWSMNKGSSYTLKLTSSYSHDMYDIHGGWTIHHAKACTRNGDELLG